MFKYFLIFFLLFTPAMAKSNHPKPKYAIPNTETHFPCWDKDVFMEGIFKKDGYRTIALKDTRKTDGFFSMVAVDKDGMIIVSVARGNKVCVISATEPGFKVDETFFKQ